MIAFSRLLVILMYKGFHKNAFSYDNQHNDFYNVSFNDWLEHITP